MFVEPIVRSVQFDTIMSVVDETVADMMPDIVSSFLKFRNGIIDNFDTRLFQRISMNLIEAPFPYFMILWIDNFVDTFFPPVHQN